MDQVKQGTEKRKLKNRTQEEQVRLCVPHDWVYPAHHESYVVNSSSHIMCVGMTQKANQTCVSTNVVPRRPGIRSIDINTLLSVLHPNIVIRHGDCTTIAVCGGIPRVLSCILFVLFFFCVPFLSTDFEFINFDNGRVRVFKDRNDHLLISLYLTYTMI